MSNITIKKGQILVYRVFDFGSEIDLDKVIKIFEEKQSAARIKLDRNYKTSLVISHAPLTLNLGVVEIPIGDTFKTVELQARLWHFGGVSFAFHIPIDAGTSWDQLLKLSVWLEKDEQIDLIAKSKAKDLQDVIKSSIPSLSNWSINEDYIIFYLQEIEGLQGSAIELLDKVDVPSLVLAEPEGNLSPQMKKMLQDYAYSYLKNDLSIVDWNSALIIEPSGSMDVPIVIEFALCQLLEMRYYDDLLDEKLNNLYNSVSQKKSRILSNKYSKIAEEAGQIYLEIAEIVESVENSLKVVGDFYLANIFRAASQRFRFKDWERSINEKLSNLAEVSKLLHDQVSDSRNQMMELIIILLIAVEVVPLVTKFIFPGVF